jgi:hypothetical protein
MSKFNNDESNSYINFNPADSNRATNSIPDIKHKSLLAQADELINSQRAADYGDAYTNFQHIADMWNATFKFKLAAGGKSFTAHDVAIAMIQLKLARLVKSPDHFDSALDVAGYIGCYEKITEALKAKYSLRKELKDDLN